MKINKMLFQYAVPGKKYNPTKNPQYEIQTTWEEYYTALFEKNYFTNNELEFLKALKKDLEEELTQVDKDIKKLQKTR